MVEPKGYEMFVAKLINFPYAPPVYEGTSLAEALNAAADAGYETAVYGFGGMFITSFDPIGGRGGLSKPLSPLGPAD